MNEWLKRIREQLTGLWGRWNRTQKAILFSIVGASILAIILLFALSATPAYVPLISQPIADADSRLQIAGKLDELGIKYQLRGDNEFYVSDEITARRVRMLLNQENLIPRGTDPWALFDTQSWTTTDFERDVNLQRSVTRQLEQHIRALDDVDAVSVVLQIPRTELFAADQKPVSASISITPKPGSDFTTNRKKVEGVQRLIKLAVAGLKDENIVITDNTGVQLNDFTGLVDVDRLELAKRELKVKQDLEAKYTSDIRAALADIFSPDRVRILKIDIKLDMSKENSTAEEYSPVAVVPATRFAPAQYAPSIARSTQNTEEHFQGSGFNPEGPPGVEGQTPPAYKDLSNLVGKYDKTSQTTNNEINKKVTTAERQPWDIRGISTGVAIDGVWKEKYDKGGRVVLNPDGSIQRDYAPVSDDDLAKAKALIQAAIGFNRDRGDAVEVQTIPFDRTTQFEKEDSVFRRALQVRRIIYGSLIGLGALLLLALAYRLIAKELERRRRLREEELARQHQAMREAALRTAEEQGVEVELSVEDRARLEMQENAANMAREHPEDVAQLIRTWLVEE
ncbi:MAG TPA: flagellar basal-body MS-ring/collar protein FliF [Spirochaetia bacterium]|nr:flagellar basal-body MS-ring/collar protein FliF [Spirochaetia bacterium]